MRKIIYLVCYTVVINEEKGIILSKTQICFDGRLTNRRQFSFSFLDRRIVSESKGNSGPGNIRNLKEKRNEYAENLPVPGGAREGQPVRL